MMRTIRRGATASRAAGLGALVVVTLAAGTPVGVPAHAGAGQTTAARAAAPELTLLAVTDEVARGEAAHLRGEVRAAGRPLRRQRVVIQVRVDKRWQELDSTRTGRRGRFLLQVTPSARTTRYRLRVPSSPKTSVVVRIRRTDQRRSLAERRAAIGFLLGPARGRVTSTRRLGRRVVHQRFARGLIAQVGGKSLVVHRRMWRHYRRAGGLDGPLGAPVADMRCQLLEDACLQRFQGGSIYLNRRARHPVSIGYATDRSSALLAVALSQTGYVEPGYRESKYGAWQGSREAWCGIYLAWASRAAGLGNAVPRAASFPQMLTAVRGPRIRKKPAVGRLAFYGRGRPWHVGLIVAVRGGRIHTVEGNVARQSDTGFPRGVFRKSRPISAAKFFYDPS